MLLCLCPARRTGPWDADPAAAVVGADAAVRDCAERRRMNLPFRTKALIIMPVHATGILCAVRRVASCLRAIAVHLEWRSVTMPHVLSIHDTVQEVKRSLGPLHLAFVAVR